METLTCGTCLGGLVPAPSMAWTDCPPCERASQRYRKLTGEDADADYAFHELAHHIVLFRSLPHRRRDWRRIEKTILERATGRAQMHEMRVLALQAVAYEVLGWNPAVERLVEMSWPGLDGADDSYVESVSWRDIERPGRKVVSTLEAATTYVRAIMFEVSSRNVRMYTNAARRLRGDAR